MSTEPISAMRAAQDALSKPFPENAVGKLFKAYKKQPPDGPKAECKVCGSYHSTAYGVHLDYVGHANIRDRLLLVDPLWTWEPLANDPNGLPLFVLNGGRPVGLWIKLTVHLAGAAVTRLGFGSVEPNAFDAEKQLIGDALRNAAMSFGVALTLWAKGDLESELIDHDVQPAGAGGSGGTTSTAKPSTAALTAPTQPAPAGPSPKTPAEAVAKLQADRAKTSPGSVSGSTADSKSAGVGSNPTGLATSKKKPDPEATGSTVFEETKLPAWAERFIGGVPVRSGFVVMDEWLDTTISAPNAKGPLGGGRTYRQVMEGSKDGGRHKLLLAAHERCLARWRGSEHAGPSVPEEKALRVLEQMHVNFYGAWAPPPVTAEMFDAPAEEGQYDPVDAR